MDSALALVDSQNDIEALYRADADRLWRAVYGGSEPNIFDLECPVDADDVLLYSCQADIATIAFSPDGTRLAYRIWESSHDQGKKDVAISIAVHDLSTGLVTKLASTRTTRPAEACDTSDYQRAHKAPRWSPDGTRMVFGRDSMGPSPNGDCQEAIFTVNANGSDLRQVVPPGQPHADLLPTWSSEGLRVSGTGGGAWTRDGRIVSLRFPADGQASGDLWIMDADGGHARRLEATIPALTAAGCVVCPYPVFATAGGVGIDPLVDRPYERFWMTNLFWQPVPAGQP